MTRSKTRSQCRLPAHQEEEKPQNTGKTRFTRLLQYIGMRLAKRLIGDFGILRPMHAGKGFSCWKRVLVQISIFGPIWQARDAIFPRAIESTQRAFFEICTRTSHESSIFHAAMRTNAPSYMQRPNEGGRALQRAADHLPSIYRPQD